ncbi:MAG: protein kinase [Clostridia bacterium]|nr:protein kinase [Clostridia bacterium]
MSNSSKYDEYVGKVLDRRYKILEPVGEGGMAFVLKAEDLIMNRLVAIKILNSEYNSDEAMVQRFLNESKAVAMLSHKNIVSIYDVAIYDDMKYIVMEFLDGITLKEYIDSKGLLFWKEGCFYAIQILKALEHAHSKGVIHRDIKPQNIMLQKSAEIKVTDFGIAKLPNASSLTVAEKAIGTVYYISPEQASGKKTDFHADLYSVGIMLYEMCTGRLPFVHENALNVAMMQVNDDPVEPIKVNPAIPEGLNQIILRAMEKAPEARFPSAHAMLKALEVLYNNPDVVFTSGSTEAAVLPNVVNIDSIATASIGDITPYGGIDVSVFAEKKISHEAKEPKKKKKKTKTDSAAGDTGKRKRSLFTGSSHSMFPIIAGVSAAFLIVVAMIMVVLFNSYIKSIFDGSNIPTEIKVPDVEGMIYGDELLEQLKASYKIDVLDENVSYEKSDRPKNEILTQNPVEGIVNLPEGKEFYTGLKLTVSYGPKESVYQDLCMYTKSYALNMLSKWNIEEDDISVINVPDSNGLIPPAVDEERVQYASQAQVLLVQRMDAEGNYAELVTGDIIREGEKFRIYVYAPEIEVNMPNLMELTEEEAARMLDEIGLVLGEVTEEESVSPDGKVIWQEFDEGTLMMRGTPVSIRISKQCKFMPNVLGLTESEARAAMLHPDVRIYNYSFIYDPTSTEEAGTVIDVTHKGGDPVFSTDTVILTVSAGASGEESSVISEESYE